MATQHGLMSEEEVQQYFISNGGIVRNNDIVTYFRNYLANPAIRDEARALFKVIVNKIATVKVENGEKFLVLKRQYFLPIDGNGHSNSGLSTGPMTGSKSSFGLPLPTSSTYSSQRYDQQHDTTGLPISGSSQNFKPFPYQSPPPYVSSGAYPLIQSLQSSPPINFQQSPTQTQLTSHQVQNQMSKSQPQLYGSQFSLSSTYNSILTEPSSYLQSPPPQAQPKYNRSPSNVASQLPLGTDYGYGLPPPPLQNSKQVAPRRLSFSSLPTSSSQTPLILSPGNMMMIPPPYRPPPPAPSYLSSTPAPINQTRSATTGINFRNSVSAQSHNHLNTNLEPTMTGFPYQRSLSVSGLTGSSTHSTTSVHKGSQSASPSTEQNPFFPLNNTQSPPPPVPPRAKRSASSLERSPLGSSSSTGSTVTMDETNTSSVSICITPDKEIEIESNDKENDFPTQPDTGINSTGSTGEFLDVDQKISVRERTQKFNKINSENDLMLKLPNGTSRTKREPGSKHDSGEYDTASLTSYSYGYAPEPKAREWILKAARSDYAGINKMAQETPNLVKRKDINGYTALHWAAKHGHADLVKLLAGTYKSDVNAKSNGGYTPLHLAAQFSRQDVYDLLVTVYNADANLRDHSGKKPMQYLVRQDTSVSMDTFKSESVRSSRSFPGLRYSFRNTASASTSKPKKRTSSNVSAFGELRMSKTYQSLLRSNPKDKSSTKPSKNFLSPTEHVHAAGNNEHGSGSSNIIPRTPTSIRSFFVANAINAKDSGTEGASNSRESDDSDKPKGEDDVTNLSSQKRFFSISQPSVDSSVSDTEQTLGVRFGRGLNEMRQSFRKSMSRLRRSSESIND